MRDLTAWPAVSSLYNRLAGGIKTGKGAARACPVCGSAVTDTQGNKRDSAAGGTDDPTTK